LISTTRWDIAPRVILRLGANHGGDSGYRVCDMLTEHCLITMEKRKQEREQRLKAAAKAKSALIKAALTKYVNQLDIIAPIEEWPTLWKDLLFTEHKNRNQRYNLMIWLWRNGVLENIARDIVLYHNKWSGLMYDRDAMRQMDELVRELGKPNSRTAEYAHAKPMYIMEEREVLPRVNRS